MQIVLAGATGTIGQTVAQELLGLGHHILCPLRQGSSLQALGPEPLVCQLTEQGSLFQALNGKRVDAVISCLATRTGSVSDAWTVEHDAQVNLLKESAAAGARHFVLLSAICVQKPRLAFQHAKLAFEQRLMESGLVWSIVRPTAFFKSLSGQVTRVQAGKPYLVFGNGTMTSCKPISNRDLARFLVGCLSDPDARNAILPIGGPGAAITPLEQAHRLYAMLGEKPNIRHVPFALMGAIAGTLGLLGRFSSTMHDRAEFARTGQYYATESMLVWNQATGRYDADATPAFGSDTLWDHYADLLGGRATTDLGDHAVF
jgi:divinyl chlorophyllide a 8-vinyl-reductase